MRAATPTAAGSVAPCGGRPRTVSPWDAFASPYRTRPRRTGAAAHVAAPRPQQRSRRRCTGHVDAPDRGERRRFARNATAVAAGDAADQSSTDSQARGAFLDPGRRDRAALDQARRGAPLLVADASSSAVPPAIVPPRASMSAPASSSASTMSTSSRARRPVQRRLVVLRPAERRVHVGAELDQHRQQSPEPPRAMPRPVDQRVQQRARAVGTRRRQRRVAPPAPRASAGVARLRMFRSQMILSPVSVSSSSAMSIVAQCGTTAPARPPVASVVNSPSSCVQARR